jgi:1,3-beta-glucanosyltransferase GAS1
MLQNYLACGTNASEAVDFYCLNAYEWCGSQSSYQISGYAALTQEIVNYNIPIFFSETGCNTVPPRDFADQAAVFGPDMSPYWSGSIIYEWIEEQNNYGLVNYGPKVDPTAQSAPPDGFSRSGTPTPISPDFSNLSNQWKTLTPSGVAESAYSPTLTAPPCPAYTSGVWEVNGNVGLPSLGAVYDAAARSSITAGTAAVHPSASASASATKKAGASPAREVKGMGLGLAGVLVGFFWWM